MEIFVLHRVAESTKLRKQQTEFTKVQQRTDLIIFNSDDNDYVQFNSIGFRSEALAGSPAGF